MKKREQSRIISIIFAKTPHSLFFTRSGHASVLLSMLFCTKSMRSSAPLLMRGCRTNAHALSRTSVEDRTSPSLPRRLLRFRQLSYWPCVTNEEERSNFLGAYSPSQSLGDSNRISYVEQVALSPTFSLPFPKRHPPTALRTVPTKSAPLVAPTPVSSRSAGPHLPAPRELLLRNPLGRRWRSRIRHRRTPHDGHPYRRRQRAVRTPWPPPWNGRTTL